MNFYYVLKFFIRIIITIISLHFLLLTFFGKFFTINRDILCYLLLLLSILCYTFYETRVSDRLCCFGYKQVKILCIYNIHYLFIYLLLYPVFFTKDVKIIYKYEK